MLGNIPLKTAQKQTQATNQPEPDGRWWYDHPNSDQQTAQLLHIDWEQSELGSLLLRQMEKAT